MFSKNPIILVVEDDKTIQKITQFSINSIGNKVRAIIHGEENNSDILSDQICILITGCKDYAKEILLNHNVIGSYLDHDLSKFKSQTDSGELYGIIAENDQLLNNTFSISLNPPELVKKIGIKIIGKQDFRYHIIDTYIDEK